MFDTSWHCYIWQVNLVLIGTDQYLACYEIYQYHITIRMIHYVSGQCLVGQYSICQNKIYYDTVNNGILINSIMEYRDED